MVFENLIKSGKVSFRLCLFYRSSAQDNGRLLADGVGAGHARGRDDDACDRTRTNQVRPVLGDRGGGQRDARTVHDHDAGCRAAPRLRHQLVVGAQ